MTETNIRLTVRQIHYMCHAIGLDTRKIKRNGTFKAVRNYFYLHSQDKEWNELCEQDIATWYHGDDYTDVVYVLKDYGIRILEMIFGIKIIMED